jgi:hypothetical protein
MKKTIFIVFILLSIKTNAQVIQVTNYTNNSQISSLDDFKLSQNNLIWKAWVSSVKHIMYYKGNTSTTIDFNEGGWSTCKYIDTYNDKFVCDKSINNQSYSSIIYYDGNDTTTLFVCGNSKNPKIYKNYIAYVQRNTSHIIRIYDGQNVVSGETFSAIQQVSDVTDNKVLFKGELIGGSGAIGLHIFDANTNTFSTIFNNTDTISVSYCKMSGNAVLYLKNYFISPANELCLYKNGNSIQLNNNLVCQYACDYATADIDSNKVVWLERNLSIIPSSIGNLAGTDIYYYDGVTTQHIANSTDPNITFYSPQVSGNNIVWICKDKNYNPILTYLAYYNGTTINKLNFIDQNLGLWLDDRAPKLSGNYLAWQAFNYSTSYSDNLYIADITTLPLVTLNINKNIISNINIKVYPNPVSDKLKIDIQNVNSLKSTIISVYDTQGKLLLQQTITKQQTELNISDFAKGIYILKVSDTNNTTISKFVKE